MMKGKFNLFFLFFLCFLSFQVSAQLQVDAGTNVYLCPSQNAKLGGSPTAKGGTPPYHYKWYPQVSKVYDDTLANPSLVPDYSTIFYVTVTDSTGTMQTDSVFVFVDPLVFVNAGKSLSVCIGDTIPIGAPFNTTASGVSYTWAPDSAFTNINLPNPLITPTVTSTYTLIAKDAACPAITSFITVYVNLPPVVSAGPDVVIKQGEKVTLQGSGVTYYDWKPQKNLLYFDTSTPDAEPDSSLQYIVFGTNDSICFVTDTVYVTVLPYDSLIFYNTFTPNKDGDNDLWVIGNIQKYPDARVEIYNRYGKLVFRTTGYNNNWDGTNFGDPLPEATYYYIVTPGSNKVNGSDMGVYKGSVTIIR